jgi:hypothetical protein
MRRIACVVTAVFLTVACGDAARSGELAVETVIDTVGGVVFIQNSGPAPEWAVERVVRLGTVEGGPQAFGRIRSVIADADGNVYVADNLANQIRVFAQDGRHLRDIGRPGAGPGEFRDLYSLAWLDESLAAMDPRNARIAVLAPTGEWIEGIQHFPITGPPSLIRLHPLGDDGFYAPAIDMRSQSIPFVRMTRSGPMDTIAAPVAPADVRSAGVVCRRPDGGITGISVPEAPSMVYGFPIGGGAVAKSWTEIYQIVVESYAGDTLRVVRRLVDPLPYTDQLWDEAIGPYNSLRENFPGAQCQPASMQRPRSRAALRHLLFDDRERMWVEAAAQNGFRWEIFDRDGRLVGTAALPPRAVGIPPYVRTDHLYQVETDEMDVQYVGVYRIASTD